MGTSNAPLVWVKCSSPLLLILNRSYLLLPTLTHSYPLLPALTRSTFFEPNGSFLTCSDALLFSFLLNNLKNHKVLLKDTVRPNEGPWLGMDPVGAALVSLESLDMIFDV